MDASKTVYRVDRDKALRLFAAEKASSRPAYLLLFVLLVLLAGAAVLFDGTVVRVVLGLLLGYLLLVAAMGYWDYRAPPPSDPVTGRQLELDAEGLSRWDGNRRVARRWNEVSAFTQRGSPYGRGEEMIIFNEMGGLRLPRIFSWRRKRREPYGLALIDDVYEAPIAEIRARLNECRDRDLETPGSSGAPSTPDGETPSD